MHNKLEKGSGIPGNMGMDHVGIIVPDAQLAVDFFMDVFDAEFDWEVRREPRPTAGERGWSEIFDIHPDAWMPHVVMLKCGEQPLTQYIEIFEWKSPDQQQLSGEGGWHRFSDIGNSYVSFTVKDMDAVVEHIKKKVIPKYQGVRFIQDPPMEFPLRGETCISTFLVSPWGMWIELTCWSLSKEKGTVISAQRVPEINPYIGKSINELPTPAFMVDLDIIDHNCSLMKAAFTENKISWRTPAKAHKCPELAKYIIDKGACGIVVLTLSEAEQFAASGLEDIYLANVVAGQDELKRLSLLAKKIRCLRVAVDSAEYLLELADTIMQWEILTPIEILVELNINHNRCGVNVSEALELAKLASQIEKELGAVKFVGITGYEGHTPIMPPEQKTRETFISHQILAKAKDLIEQHGIKVEHVSAGGSCNYMDVIKAGVVNEIQAGGGAIGDLLYYHKAHLKDHGHLMAALLLTEVISVPADKSRAVANAGFKSVGIHPFGDLPGFRDRNDLEVIGLSAEHARIMPVNPEKSLSLTRGVKLVMIPGYLDAMGFLHKKIYALRNDHVVEVWDTI